MPRPQGYAEGAYKTPRTPRMPPTPVGCLNYQVLASLGLEKHPDKTFIGRIERGFDFLGYHFGPDGLRVAEATIEKFVERATRLYEREPGDASTSTRLVDYVRRWVRRVRA